MNDTAPPAGDARPVRLDGTATALVLLLPARGMPRILAFGPAMPDAAADLAALTGRASRINGMDVDVPSAVLLPTGGMGAFQWPAIAGHRDGRAFTLDVSGWRVERPGPARLTLEARDEAAAIGLAIDLAFAAGDVLTMASRLTNLGETPYTLDRCLAASMAAPEATHILALGGRWGGEFRVEIEPLGLGVWLRESRRGRTSHDRFPGIVLGGAGLAEGEGPCLGLHLGWSGNHVVAVDRLDDGGRLVHAGELFEPGEVRLAPGETYASPTAHLARAASLDALSAAFHAHLRADILAWPGGAMRPRPVTLNTWEGTYFAHDLADLKLQADAAASLGIERFVLDDGWFGRRDDDTTSLGDWTVDPRKYPDGLGPLVDHVTGRGMEFGIWMEPEMVNPVSDLFRAHPEWALQVAGRPLLTSRNQLVLDLTRPEVSDYLFERIDAVLSAHAVRYIKWDMNRDLNAVGDAQGRAATGRQTRAAYALMARIRAAHPDVEIESCASGGGRADYGALAYTHRVWTSDCTDALERLEIQRGASLFLPPEVMGAHVSASPNHQTGRRHTLAFRAIVAMTGHFGVEMSPLDLDIDEAVELARWIVLHKRLRPVLHGRGAAFRHPPRQGRHVWGIVAPDRSAAVVVAAQASLLPDEKPRRLTVPGLEPGASYRLGLPGPVAPDFIRAVASQEAVLRGEVAVTGAELAAIGFALPDLRPETAALIEITRIEETHGHG